MQKIYLFRHGQPDFPAGEKLCIGTTDLPLSPLGHLQACLQSIKLPPLVPGAVYASPLLRSRQTAAYFSDHPTILEDLREMSAGLWEGLSFRQIRLQWPELYEARGLHPRIPIPEAEELLAVQKRFLSALDQACISTDGDLVVVSHASCIQTLLCRIHGRDARDIRCFPIPYGSLTLLSRNPSGYHLLSGPAEAAPPPLTPAICRQFWHAVHLPAHIQAHCQMVAKVSLSFCDALNRKGLQLDRSLLENAALLHDLARLQKQHAQTGGQWMTALGYPRTGTVIRQHDQLDQLVPDEAAVLFLADKLVQGTQLVTLHQRFAASAGKCLTREGKDRHALRLHQAQTVQHMMFQILQITPEDFFAFSPE